FNGYLVDLKGTGAPFVRDAILEQTNTFQFIAYSLQSDQPVQTANQFNPGVLRNKQYAVVTLTQKFGDADPIKTSSGLYLWTEGSSSSFSESQPAAPLFNTQTLGRAADGTLLAPAPETPAATARDRRYESIPNLVYTNEYPQGQNYYTGRLSLTVDGSNWFGMSDPRGKLLTFNLNTGNDGQGIVHAVELPAAAPTSLAGE